MVLNNVIVDVTIPRRSFVLGQSRAKVSALVIALLILDRMDVWLSFRSRVAT